MKSAKTILITGANTGIGAAAALLLARPGVHLQLACRSEEKTRPVLEKVREKGARASFVHLDLGDLAHVCRTARELARDSEPLDLLIDNAGLAGKNGLTKDGFDLLFGTNHLGHFAFTLPLLPRLIRARGRVVVVSSGSHRQAKEIPWTRLREPGRSVSGMPEYAFSKLCNVLFAAELRRRVPEITAVSLHPGRIASDIWRRVPQPFRFFLPTLMSMKSVEYGGGTLVNASEVDLSGKDAPLYFHMEQAGFGINPLALREDLARELWKYSEDAIRPFVPARREREPSKGMASTASAAL